MTLVTNITETHKKHTISSHASLLRNSKLIRFPFSKMFQKTSDRWRLSVSFLIHVTSKMVECVPLTNAGDALLGCSHAPGNVFLVKDRN